MFSLTHDVHSKTSCSCSGTKLFQFSCKERKKEREILSHKSYNENVRENQIERMSKMKCRQEKQHSFLDVLEEKNIPLAFL